MFKAYVAEKTSWKSDGVSFYQIYTNSLGFVDEINRDVPLKKSGKRILILGDSFMEGVGYPWHQTVPGILSDRFKKQGVELLNGAVISYSPKIYYLKLKHFLEMGLEIDELYVFIDISDIIDLQQKIGYCRSTWHKQKSLSQWRMPESVSTFYPYGQSPYRG